MATILILHVIAIGILLSRFPLRMTTLIGFYLYFWGFYVAMGNYLKTHRAMITPTMPLEDDYYNHYQPKKKSPFEPSESSPKETEDKEFEENRHFQKRKSEESKDQPSTKP